MALADLGESDPTYVARAAAGWAEETKYRWAVCEPTTGELLAEITLDPVSAAIGSRHRDGHHEAAATAAAAVARFAAGALGLTPVVLDVDGAISADEHPRQADGSQD